MTVRLQKLIAQAGIASRRKAEQLIKNGRVSVNGNVVREMGFRAGESDVVAIDGKKIDQPEKKVYILLNKPAGYISTAKDQFARKTVMDLVKGISQRIYPVGRLDFETSGLLLLTNDGELAYKLTHPKHEVKKVYEAEVEGTPKGEDIELFNSGIDIGDHITAPSQMAIRRSNKGKSIIEITIHEGKYRQVRRMCAAIGHPVRKLKRIAEGPLSINGLKEGQWRYLRDDEIEKLLNME